MKKTSILFLAVQRMMLAFFWVATVEAHQTLDTLSFYRARFFSPDEETFRGNVRAITQTTDGFLWVGTENGLARFDGEQFDYLPLALSNNIPDEPVNALAADAKGGLWIATRSGLFYCKNGECTQPELPPAAHKNILSIAQSADGTLWIGTQTGLLRQSAGGDSIQISSKGLGLPIRSLITDEKGYLWAGAGGNLLRLTPTDLDEDVFYSFRALRLDFIRSVCRRRDGSAWMGSNSGLVRFANGQCTLFTKTNGLPDNTVTSVFEDSRGNLWVGTYGGLCRFADEKFIIEATPEGEPYNQIFCFFEDRENNFWVGSKEGLHRFNLQPFTTYTTRHGLAHNNVISIYEDTEEALWVGTWGGGLHRFKGGEITIYSTDNTSMLRNDLILALHGAPGGGLWFGADYDGGLYQMKDGQFRRYGPNQGLARNAIRALLEDSAGRLFVATATEYLNILEDGRFMNYGKPQGVPTNSTRCLLQARDGTIWMGTAAGLSRWTNSGFITLTKTNGLPDDSVFSLHEDKEQNLWIGTGRGLARLTPHGLHITLHSHASFFPDAILEILEDDFENLWLATKRGVFRVANSELQKNLSDPKHKVAFTQFGKADGMASPVCVGVAKPSAFKTKDGRLWFATTKGLAVTDPKLQLAKNEKPPAVVIREVIVDKKELKATGSESGKTGTRENEKSHFPAFSATPLLVPPGRGELEFHYTALSYTAPEKNRFKYRLKGVDKDWVDAGTRREAFYNNVPPGSYTFQVIACNNDGVWNELGQNVKLTLQPHIWQTAWFKSLIILFVLGLVSLQVRYTTKKRMQYKLERLEQQHAIEKERTRIAQDMHDDLGARLTEIVLLSNLAKTIPDNKSHVENIASSANEVVRNLDAMVWAVDPGKDSLENLVFYIQEYVEMFFGTSSIRCRLEIPEELPPCTVSSEVRHHVFMVIKEALNNAVKYSGATEIWIRLRIGDESLSISIEDGGKGFIRENISASSNGLLNMEKRMMAIGGKFSLESEPGKGTRICVAMPLRGCSGKRQM